MTRACDSGSTSHERRARAHSRSSESGSITNSEDDYASMDDDVIENGEIKEDCPVSIKRDDSRDEDDRSRSSQGGKHVPITWPYASDKLEDNTSQAGTAEQPAQGKAPSEGQVFGFGPTKRSVCHDGGQNRGPSAARARYAPYTCMPRQSWSRGPRSEAFGPGPAGAAPRTWDQNRRGPPGAGGPLRQPMCGGPPSMPLRRGVPGQYVRDPAAERGRVIVPLAPPRAAPFNAPLPARMLVPAEGVPRMRMRAGPPIARPAGADMWAGRPLEGPPGPLRFHSGSPRSCSAIEGIAPVRRPPPGLTRAADWAAEPDRPRSRPPTREVVRVYTPGPEYEPPRARSVVHRLPTGEYEDAPLRRAIAHEPAAVRRLGEDRALETQVERIVDGRPVHLVRVEAPRGGLHPRVERYETVDAAVVTARPVQRAASYVTVPAGATYCRQSEAVEEQYVKTTCMYEDGLPRSVYRVEYKQPVDVVAHATLRDRAPGELVLRDADHHRRSYSCEPGPQRVMSTSYQREAASVAHRPKVAGGQPSPILSHNENVSEWMYRDPQGTVRGPYSIRQFRQWVGNLENKGDLLSHLESFLSVELWKEGSDAKATIRLETILKLNQPPEA